jgi:AcrR family transcriptional regulator
MRSDGLRSREQIIAVALKLFAEQGFANTSTRQISAGAGVNLAQIAYHFGDKAGLYRAAFTEPMRKAAAAQPPDMALPAVSKPDLRRALTGLYSSFIEPLKQSDAVRACIRLHMREMVEPTGLWDQEVDDSIRPQHAALTKLLMLHLGLQRMDDDVHRLAFAIVALGVHMYVGRDVMERVAPRLIASDKALDTLRDRWVMFAMAMVKAEAKRRKELSGNE